MHIQCVVGRSAGNVERNRQAFRHPVVSRSWQKQPGRESRVCRRTRDTA